MAAFSINDKVALVTGASGGIGSSPTKALLKRGAAKAYAADICDPLSRSGAENDISQRIVTLKLDVTDDDSGRSVDGS